MKYQLRFALLAAALLVTLTVSLTAKTSPDRTRRLSLRLPASHIPVTPQPTPETCWAGIGR